MILLVALLTTNLSMVLSFWHGYLTFWQCNPLGLYWSANCFSHSIHRLSKTFCFSQVSGFVVRTKKCGMKFEFPIGSQHFVNGDMEGVEGSRRESFRLTPCCMRYLRCREASEFVYWSQVDWKKCDRRFCAIGIIGWKPQEWCWMARSKVSNNMVKIRSSEISPI